MKGSISSVNCWIDTVQIKQQIKYTNNSFSRMPSNSIGFPTSHITEFVVILSRFLSLWPNYAWKGCIGASPASRNGASAIIINMTIVVNVNDKSFDDSLKNNSCISDDNQTHPLKHG